MRKFTFTIPGIKRFSCDAPDRDMAVMNANTHFKRALYDARGGWVEVDHTGDKYRWAGPEYFA